MGTTEASSICRCWQNVKDEVELFGAVDCMADHFVGNNGDNGVTMQVLNSVSKTAQNSPQQPPAIPFFSLQKPVVPTFIRVWCAARPSLNSIASGDHPHRSHFHPVHKVFPTTLDARVGTHTRSLPTLLTIPPYRHSSIELS